jgi:hypothetical protein
MYHFKAKYFLPGLKQLISHHVVQLIKLHNTSSHSTNCCEFGEFGYHHVIREQSILVGSMQKFVLLVSNPKPKKSASNVFLRGAAKERKVTKSAEDATFTGSADSF